jgi:hypothetical protein
MLMRRSVWLILLVALALVAGGCERQQPQLAPQQVPVVEEQKEQVAEEATGQLPGQEAVQQETAASQAPPAPPAEPALPGEAAPVAPVQAAKPAPAPVAVSAPAEEKPAPAAVSAAIPQPEVVTYDGSYGRVLFNHQSHAAMDTCGSCHGADPPGKIALGKDKAHQLCRGCHQQKSAGPTQCNACHHKG